jgi:murein DD-endopeptidase MepM/ murein hydrolase activator NlpD
MEADKRYFHLGIDFVLPAGTAIYAPISGVVEESGYEEGDGNYGGYVILRHEFPQTETFYTMFGHLSLSHLPEIGRSVSQSDKIGEVGAQHENGGWNEHTHVQVITEKGKEKGFFFKGYCNAATMPEITELCPDPYPIVAGTILK